MEVKRTTIGEATLVSNQKSTFVPFLSFSNSVSSEKQLLTCQASDLQ
jgi:hypothetical protein